MLLRELRALGYPGGVSILKDHLAQPAADPRIGGFAIDLACGNCAGGRVHARSLRPMVDALQSLRGIGLITAVTLVAEIGDIRRFRRPAELMAYLGLCPVNVPAVRPSSVGVPRKRGTVSRARCWLNLPWSATRYNISDDVFYGHKVPLLAIENGEYAGNGSRSRFMDGRCSAFESKKHS